MERWSELRTAYQVASLGTVSAAAERLGIHRATVVRHIDALEKELGGRLFQRHRQGYALTEAGRDLLRVVRAADEQFELLAGRTRGRSAQVTGELVVTSVAVVAPLLLPALRDFRRRHPDTTVQLIASRRVLELAYGDAHVAVRTGARPDHPDNVVRPLPVLRSGLYAHRRYADVHGVPNSLSDLDGHGFVADGSVDEPGPTRTWLRALAPSARIVFSSGDWRVNTRALREGLGIGFLPEPVARLDPDLIEVHPPDPRWEVPLWLVTHVDLHRTAKVQAAVRCLRESLGVPSRAVEA